MMIDTRFKGARRRVILKTRHFHAFRLLYTTIRLTFLVAEYFLYVFKYIKAIFEVITSRRIYELNQGLNCLFKFSPRFLCRPTALYIFARAVGRQSAIYPENSGFASPALGRHISTFRGYRILLTIRNPYINRFTNHFSIHS